MSARDYRVFRFENAQNRSLENSSQFAKARHRRAFLRVLETFSLRARLPGWRRSADRTRLHANSLLTGNFAILRLRAPILWLETNALQCFLHNSLSKLTGKSFGRTGEKLAGSGNCSAK
jgi:hypothetical protein